MVISKHKPTWLVRKAKVEEVGFSHPSEVSPGQRVNITSTVRNNSGEGIWVRLSAVNSLTSQTIASAEECFGAYSVVDVSLPIVLDPEIAYEFILEEFRSEQLEGGEGGL